MAIDGVLVFVWGPYLKQSEWKNREVTTQLQLGIISVDYLRVAGRGLAGCDGPPEAHHWSRIFSAIGIPTKKISSSAFNIRHTSLQVTV